MSPMEVQSARPDLVSTKEWCYSQWQKLWQADERLITKVIRVVTLPLLAIATLFLEIVGRLKTGFICIVRGNSAENQYLQLTQLHRNLDPNLFIKASKQIGRNRYGDVLPNEPTRFKIANDPDFYFNANWVLNEHAIACQGPLLNEIDEFWKMVWHSDVRTIVMLTNPTEGSKDKCSKYWESKEFSEEKIFQNGNEAIVKRTIQISKMFQTKTIVQYHLQNWPDHGTVTPGTLSALVSLVAQEEGKILAHCSAGIGRTGTFLAAYEAFRRGAKEIFSIASDLRDPLKGRVGMIQSIEQYLLALQTAQELFPKTC